LASTKSANLPRDDFAMTSDTVLPAFAERLHDLCTAAGLGARGRYSALAKKLEVTPNAARKWLLGQGFPELAMAVRICNLTDPTTNLLWLLQGTGTRTGERLDNVAAAVNEVLDQLPREQRNAVLEFIRFTIVRTPGWFAEEQRARYLTSLDALSARESPAGVASTPSKITPLPLGRKRSPPRT
jgi:transcriptional regulator with XRE-family HTH domain